MKPLTAKQWNTTWERAIKIAVKNGWGFQQADFTMCDSIQCSKCGQWTVIGKTHL